MRDLVDLGADALLDVGGTVDHRVEQIHQHRFARHLGRARARQFVLDDGERARIVVAHRHQAMGGKNEGDRRGLRRRGIRLAHQRRGHVAAAVLDIEAAGDLDFLHLFARGHRDAEHGFDQSVFLHGRRDQIDPHRRLRRRLPGLDRNSLKRSATRNVDREHHVTISRVVALPNPRSRAGWIVSHDPITQRRARQ